MVDLFAHHAADGARLNKRFNEDVVADDVELFLLFALDVFRASQAEHAGERTLTHERADRLAGFGNARNDACKLRIEASERFFASEVLLKR